MGGSLLFLSYAEEDEHTAAIVAAGLRARGHEVYNWRDRERQAGLFIQEIEGAIQRADAYVALLSPSFIASLWCRRERELALRRELDLQASDEQRVFIFVLRITPGHYPDAGLLRSYAWLDLEPGDESKALDTVHARLEGIDQGKPMGEAARAGAELAPLFRNRRQELDRVLGGLLNPVGPHFWLVVAPPQLGKTWFLHRISAELEEQSPGWVARLIDMREQPAEFRRNSRAILAQFFSPRQQATSGSGLPGDIAKMILRSNKAHLCLIDSAELLDERTIASLRRVLGEIHRLVEDAGREGVWLTLIVASRREEHWRGMDPLPLLTPQTLTEFPPTIVQQALRDLAREMGRNAIPSREFSRWANQLHRQSEGLPRVLVAYQRWIRMNEWVGMRNLGRSELFAELGYPYIRDELLSADSLVPMVADMDGRRHRALMEAFRVLAPYRLFTRFHLAYHNDLDSALQGAITDAGWVIEDLWKAISRTALLVQPLDEPWQEIYPAIRRLLYRFYYNSPETQIAAHLEARKLMEAWAGEQYGKEQAVGLVECLWHEAGQLRLNKPAALKERLMQSAANLSTGIRSSNAYTLAEIREYACGRLLKDEEFRQSSGLTATLLRLLAQIIAAPGSKELWHD